MTQLNAPEEAPYGPDVIATDCVDFNNPSGDQVLSNVGRSMLVLADGTLSVRTLAGNDRTFPVVAGMTINLAIQIVLDATTCHVLVYQK